MNLGRKERISRNHNHSFDLINLAFFWGGLGEKRREGRVERTSFVSSAPILKQKFALHLSRTSNNKNFIKRYPTLNSNQIMNNH